MVRRRFRFTIPALGLAVASGSLALAQPQAAQQPPAIEEAQPDVPAEERLLTLWTGRVQSDNITRAEFGAVNGHYDSLGLLLGLGRTSSRLEAGIRGDLEYRRYSVENVDSETVGTLDATAEIDIVRNRFSWLFADEFGQGSMDPFSATRPGNRESLNVVTTGPRFMLPFGRTSLSMSADFSARRYDEATTANSDETEYEVGLFRQTRRTLQLGIVTSSSEIEYTELLAPSTTIDRIGLRYIKTLATGTMTAEIGKNEISTSTLTDDEPLYDFAWNRTLGTRSQFTLAVGRRFTDTGGLLTDDDVLTGSVILSAPNPLEEKRLTSTYLLTGTRTAVSFSLGTAEFRYIGDTTLDNDATEATIDFRRTISPRLMLGGTYEQVDRDYVQPSVTRPHDKDSTLSAWVNRALGRSFAVGVAVAKYTRGGIESFDERRYELRVAYSPTGNSMEMGTLGR